MTFDDEIFGEDETDDEQEAGESDDWSEDGLLETDADVAGGRTQDYVEDCQVCCQPCRVRVTYDEDGAAEVSLEEAQ